MTLRPCSDLSAATWITTSDLPWDRLVTFGPGGFPAYARLRLLPDPEYDGQSENDVVVEEHAPSDGARLSAALQLLRHHTTTPEDCYFCLWDGWGSSIHGSGDSVRMEGGMRTTTFYSDDQGATTRPGPRIAPAFPPSVLDGPKVLVPNRAYFLFRGPVSDLGDWGAAEMWPGRPRWEMPPAFVWPADHAWCVAHDVDPHWIGIGADAPAIDQLLADPVVDVVPADPREEQPRYR